MGRLASVAAIVGALVAASAVAIAPSAGAVPAAGELTEFPVGAPASSQPGNLVAGPDGALWFTELGRPFLGRITTDGTVSEFPITGAAYGLTSGPDGALWVSEGSRIERVTTAGAITTFDLAGASAGSITHAHDGNLWFVSSSNNLVRMTPAGVRTSFTVDPAVSPGLGNVVEGPDGNLWVAEMTLDRVARVTTSGVVTRFGPVESGSTPSPFGISSLTAGADGAVWGVEAYGTTAVVRISTEGAITSFPCPQVKTVTTGPDGAIWYLAGNASSSADDWRLGRLAPDGTTSEHPFTTTSRLVGLATGSDGNLWFSELDTSTVARMTSGIPSAAPVITTQPVSTSVPSGHPTIVRALASGSPVPTVQWESSPDGATWAPVPGATYPILTVIPPSNVPRRYRAVFTNASGFATSAVATVRGLGQVGTPTVSRSTSTVFPYRDGYTDSITLRARTTVPARGTLRVLDRLGHVVWVARLSRGTSWAFSWTGRSTAGKALSAGHYVLRAIVRGDEGTSRQSSVPLAISAKRLVAVAYSLRVTAQSAARASMGVIPEPGPVPGGVVVNFAAIGGDPAYFEQKLPAAAIRFGSTTLLTCSTRPQQHNAAANVSYRSVDGGITGVGHGIGPVAACYYSDPAPASLLLGGRTLRWVVQNATVLNSVIWIDYFILRGTEYVLR
jgi:virginiamycin B lyase